MGDSLLFAFRGRWSDPACTPNSTPTEWSGLSKAQRSHSSPLSEAYMCAGWRKQFILCVQCMSGCPLCSSDAFFFRILCSPFPLQKESGTWFVAEGCHQVPAGK